MRQTGHRPSGDTPMTEQLRDIFHQAGWPPDEIDKGITAAQDLARISHLRPASVARTMVLIADAYKTESNRND